MAACGVDGTGAFDAARADGQGGTAPATVTARLINNPPVANNDTFTVAEDSPDTEVNVLANDSIAPDTGETLTVDSITQPASGGTVTLANGGVSFTPAANFNGMVTFTYTISDGNSGTDTATVTVTVTPVNDPPTAADDTFTVAENSGATVLNVLANDFFAPDVAETLTVISVTQPPMGGTVTLNAGVVRFTPAPGFHGNTVFSYTVSDGNFGTDPATVFVTVTPVNHPPTATDDTFTVAEDSDATELDVLANDSTAPDSGEMLMVTSAASPAHGTVEFTATGVSFTPEPNFHGTTTFTYTIWDGNGGTDTATVTVTVTPQNDPPDAQEDAFTVAEDSLATELDVLANDSTAPDTGETLTVLSVTQPASGGMVTLPGGIVNFTPAANFNGTTTFTYTVSDGNGGTDTATVTVIVTPENDPPDAQEDAFTVAEGNGTSVLDVLANDSILPDTGETLTVTVVTQPAAGGTVNLVDGTLHFTPSPHFHGTELFTYTVADGNGGTDTATVLVTVLPAPPGTGGWSTTGSLITARQGHTSTVLSSGKILVTGGESSSGTLASAELYDPATGAWSRLSPMTQARRGHTATVLPSGKILVTGGTSASGTPVTLAELYDPATGTWLPTGELSTARQGHSSVVLPSGKVLVIGGEDASGPLSSAEVYDPASGAWSPTGALSTPRASHTAAVLSSGKILIAGGINPQGDLLTSAELYDPEAGTWSPTGPLITARRKHTATVLPSGTVLVAGGEGASGALASSELYDPSTGIWSATSTLNTARMGHTAELLASGKLLITGGEDATGALASTEVYSPRVAGPYPRPAMWIPVGTLATARSGHTVTALPSGQLLITGGVNSSGPLASVELFTALGASSPAAPMPEALARFMTAALPTGQLLLVGGSDSGNSLARARLYDPVTGEWTDTEGMSTPRASASATPLQTGQVLVAGGQRLGSGLLAADPGSVLASAELFDPVSKSWRSTGPLHVARHSHSALLLSSGKVLVTGGVGQDGTPLSSTEVYSVSTGSWEEARPMNVPRREHMMVPLPDGKVLVAGGLDSHGRYLNSAEVFDPGDNQWTRTDPMSTARSASTAALLPTSQVLVAGGTNGLESLASAELYDPTSGRWRSAGSLSTAREAHSTTLLPSGKLLIVGGSHNTTALEGVEMYDPYEEKWEVMIPLITPREGSVTVLLPNGKVLVMAGQNQDGTVPTAELYQEASPPASMSPTVAKVAPQKPSPHVVLKGHFLKAPLGGVQQARLQPLSWLMPIDLNEAEFSDTEARISLEGVPDGVYLFFVLVNGIAGGQVVQVDGTRPGAPSITLEGSPLQPVLKGTAEPGSTIQVWLSGQEVGSGKADVGGQWSVELSVPLKDGTYDVSATATDAAGNISQSSTSITLTVDTQPPSAPSITTLAPFIKTSKPLLSGTAEPGSTVTVSLDGQRLDTPAQMDAAGQWTLTLPLLREGKHTATATATDAAQNVSPPSAAITFTVDTQKPAAPEVLTPQEGITVAASSPAVASGTAEPDSFVTISVSLEGKEKATIQTQADSTGAWSLELPQLEAGLYTLSATAMDAAANVSPRSAERHFTVGDTSGCGCAAGSAGAPSGVMLGLTLLRLLSRRRLQAALRRREAAAR